MLRWTLWAFLSVAGEVAACDYSRLVRLVGPSVSCQAPCAVLRPLPQARSVYELIAFVAKPARSREGHLLVTLESIDRFVSPTEAMIPVAPSATGLAATGWLSGCRYQWIEQGSHAGIRPGTQVDLVLPDQGIVSWIALEVWEDRSFGVYDVAQFRQARD